MGTGAVTVDSEWQKVERNKGDRGEEKSVQWFRAEVEEGRTQRIEKQTRTIQRIVLRNVGRGQRSRF